MGNIYKKYILFSYASLFIYVLGIITLASLTKTSWRITPVFWPEITNLPVWIWFISAITIISGTMLIYFVPGIFTARYCSRTNDDIVEVCAKGFLINYFLFYLTSTLYKLIFHQELSRLTMIILIGIAISIMGVIFLAHEKRACIKAEKISMPKFNDSRFLILYLTILIGIFIIFRQQIFFSLFNGDGVEQFWLARSLKSKIIPTSFREPYTMIPQFPFAPSVFLNTFALMLFGNSEFIVRLEVLVAYVCLGIIVKKLIEVAFNKKKVFLFDHLPLFLYLIIFFVVISKYGGNNPPADLAKSSETLQLTLFFVGFYLLIKNEDILAAIFLILSSMIRSYGLLMIIFFLFLFSILFRRYRCLLVFLTGWFLCVFLLKIILLHSNYNLGDMTQALLADIKDMYSESFNLNAFFLYLRNYFILTSGLIIFFIGGLINRYILLVFLTSLFYFFLGIKLEYVPAHFFIPIFIFPLLAYYLLQTNRKKIITWLVIILEISTLYYIYPKIHSFRIEPLRQVLSRICINTTNLFEANKRCRVFRNQPWDLDERFVMYYADLVQKQDKKYLIYLGEVPIGLSEYYHSEVVNNENLYLIRSLSWQRYSELFAFSAKDYFKGNEI
jgi:hypothetical protein